QFDGRLRCGAPGSSAPPTEEEVSVQDVNQGQGSYGSMGSMPGSFWEENRSMATGVILASAVAAGVIAYMLRRAREDETPIETASDLPGRAWERAREVAGDERVDAARD